MAVWDSSEYLQEASILLQDQDIDVIFNTKMFNSIKAFRLLAKSNKIFKCLCSHNLISEKELEYFTYNFKKATNLRKLYFLPEVNKLF